MYQIDTHIPIPEDVTRGRRAVYPFLTMSVGDSFLVPFGDDKHSAVVSRVHSAVSQFARRDKNSSRKLIARAEALGVRVWRVA
jgi:hypothetical protein